MTAPTSEELKEFRVSAGNNPYMEKKDAD